MRQAVIKGKVPEHCGSKDSPGDYLSPKSNETCCCEKRQRNETTT